MPVTIKMKVEYSADEWELYTASRPCERAAAALNRAANQALNCGNPQQARTIFRTEQNKQMKFGAADSEPSYIFGRLFQQMYGQEF